MTHEATPPAASPGCPAADSTTTHGAAAGHVVLITFQDAKGPVAQTHIECRGAQQACETLQEVFTHLEAFRALVNQSSSVPAERLEAAQVTASLVAVRQLSPEFMRAFPAAGEGPSASGRQA